MSIAFQTYTIKKLIAKVSICSCFLFQFSCTNKVALTYNTFVNTSATISIQQSPEWAEMLRQKSGWIRADGIYSMPLNGIAKEGQGDSINFIQQRRTFSFHFKTLIIIHS